MRQLGESVREYYIQGLAPSTVKSYASAKSRFVQFCHNINQPCIPVSETLLCLYVSHLANENVSASSIKSYLSAIRHLQISGGYQDPHIGDMPRLSQVLRGIKIAQSKQMTGSRPRLPITPTILRQLKKSWEASASDGDTIMMWAAATTCFFGFLRVGEMTAPSHQAYDPSTHLSFKDLALDNVKNPTIMELHLKASKTDPFRKGISIFIGRTNDDICPVAAMLAYIVTRGGDDGPLFRLKNGHPLTRGYFVSTVRAGLSSGGIDHSKYSGHSFRIGAATTAARRGIPDSTIKILGRWESSAYQLYVKTPRQSLASITASLSAENPNICTRSTPSCSATTS